ncbi:MAG TPA: hypothetical protein VMW32_02580 [Bacteroidales bacterium]|nr:hypothetical protein [Bacteroidales bacterium]
MAAARTDNILNTLANIFSIVFHPLLMPLYGLVIIFSAPTVLGYLPFTVKKILFFIVLINNVLIPLTLMPYLRYRNIISSYSIEDKQERITPLMIVSFLYCITSFIVFRFQLPFFIKSFTLASTLLVIVVAIINFWWKISVHSAAAGALTGIVVILSFKMYTPLTWYLISAILMSGLVLSSRLRLNSHNPLQVWIGFLTGFAVSGLFIALF